MDFEQSKTYANLQNAYQWELTVSTRYDIFADTARQEELIEIGNIFDTTAINEKEHARIWLRQLNSGTLPDTTQNLLEGVQLETHSANDLYRLYARTALEEGYSDLAALFSGVANIELNQSLRFQTQYEHMMRNQVFCKNVATLWICMQCGNIMSGICAPEICPVCGFPQGYYRVFVETDINQ